MSEDLPKLSSSDIAKLREVTTRLAKAGWEQGLDAGGRAVVLRQLTQRFGPLSPTVVARVDQADFATLEEWAERLLWARSVDEVLRRYELQSDTAREQRVLGRDAAQRAIVVRQLTKRFGPLPSSALEQIERADIAVVEKCAERLLTARTLDQALAQ